MKVKKVVVSLFMFFIFATNVYGVGSKGKMSILKDKPVFFVKVNAYGMSYTLDINGVSVMQEFDSKSQITTTFAVNQWMRPSDNQLSIHTFPDNEGEQYHDQGKIEYSLVVRDNNEDNESHTLATINLTGKDANTKKVGTSSPDGHYNSNNNFKPEANGDVKVSTVSIKSNDEFKGGLVYSRNIHVPNSLPLWAFFTSDGLPNVDNLSDDAYAEILNNLLEEYLKVEDAIKSGDIDNILPMFKERSAELDRAYYRKPGETEHELRESLLKTGKDSTLTFAPLTPDYILFADELNGKLVRLVRDDWGAAISLDMKSGGSIRYDMYFRLSNGDWILTR